ncbi:MAG: glycosyltransferase family 2 protein [Lacibacter sp.]
MEAGFVDILILFYNKVEQTISCINSFLPSGQQIYVLNNGSDPAQLKKLQLTFDGNERVHILDAGKNLGVSGGRNYLIQHTKAPWLFSVDNDIVITNTKDWLEKFMVAISLHPDALVFIPKLFNKHERRYAELYVLEIKDNKLIGNVADSDCVNNFPGGAAIISRKVYQKFGLYDENMFVGFEDFEFAVRAMLSDDEQPMKCFILNSVELVHDHKVVNGKVDKIAVKERYSKEKMNQSFMYFLRKHNIQFEHNWEWWTESQVKLMTKNTLLETVKMFSSSLKRKLFKRLSL